MRASHVDIGLAHVQRGVASPWVYVALRHAGKCQRAQPRGQSLIKSTQERASLQAPSIRSYVTILLCTCGLRAFKGGEKSEGAATCVGRPDEVNAGMGKLVVDAADA